jgi:hypothetical protein
MKVQIVTPYRVSHLQRYDVTVRGNVTSVYPPVHAVIICVAVLVGAAQTFPFIGFVIFAYGLYIYI